MKTVAIVGASGAIGKRVYSHLSKLMSIKYNIIGTYYNNRIENFTRLDITDNCSLKNFIENNRPYCVVWLSGTKDVHKCQHDPEFAYNIHSKPIGALIGIINEYSPRTKVIFLSTDYVFDGKRGMYKEEDLCNPQTVYGISKYAAEQSLVNSNINYLIIRTSAIMNRYNGFLAWFLKKMMAGDIIDLFSNTYFTPTPIELLSRTISLSLENSKWNHRVVHVAGNRTSRYLFGRDLVNALGFPDSCIVPSILELRISTFQQDLSLKMSNQFMLSEKDIWQEIINEAKYDPVC